MNDPILVLGAGRSGTSAVAGILHNAGVFMGETFIIQNRNNPKGYFEDREFLDFHTGRNKLKQYSKEWVDALETLIKKRQALGKKWGFKDPRTLYFLEFYFKQFKNPKIIRCMRPLRDIYISMLKTRGNKIEDITEEMINNMNHNLFIGRNNLLDEIPKNRKVLDVWFDDLIKNDTSNQIDRILEYCDIQVDSKTKDKLNNFINYE